MDHVGRFGFHRTRPLHRIGRRGRIPPESFEEREKQLHDAQQRLAPVMMRNRLRSWTQPGSGNEGVDPQRGSPFYGGRLPQEVTDLIFEYALCPDASASLLPGRWPDEERPHDFAVRYDHGQSSDGPETAHDSMDTSLDQGGKEPAPGQDAVSGTQPRGGDDSAGPWRGPPSPQMRSTLGFDWYRPDAPTKTTCSGWRLLQTCRRVYLDASEFLARNHEAVVYEGRGPRNGRAVVDLYRLLEDNHNHPSYQDIRSMRVYSQMHLLGHLLSAFTPSVPLSPTRAQPHAHGHADLRSRLASGGSPAVPHWRLLHHLEAFHLTLRRTDWDRWEDNKALEINPYRNHHILDVMQRDMLTATQQQQQGRGGEGEGEPPPPPQLWFDPGAWGCMFRAMASLRTLTITLETSEDKAHEMEALVAWARTWRFEIMHWRHWLLPSASGGGGDDDDLVAAHLVAEDRPAARTSWRGLWYHWSDQCTACAAPASELRAAECVTCREREALLREGKGPRILAWTLTWRRRPVDPPVSREDTEAGPETG